MICVFLNNILIEILSFPLDSKPWLKGFCVFLYICDEVRATSNFVHLRFGEVINHGKDEFMKKKTLSDREAPKTQNPSLSCTPVSPHIDFWEGIRSPHSSQLLFSFCLEREIDREWSEASLFFHISPFSFFLFALSSLRCILGQWCGTGGNQVNVIPLLAWDVTFHWKRSVIECKVSEPATNCRRQSSFKRCLTRFLIRSHTIFVTSQFNF